MLDSVARCSGNKHGSPSIASNAGRWPLVVVHSRKVDITVLPNCAGRTSVAIRRLADRSWIDDLERSSLPQQRQVRMTDDEYVRIEVGDEPVKFRVANRRREPVIVQGIKPHSFAHPGQSPMSWHFFHGWLLRLEHLLRPTDEECHRISSYRVRLPTSHGVCCRINGASRTRAQPGSTNEATWQASPEPGPVPRRRRLGPTPCAMGRDSCGTVSPADSSGFAPAAPRR